MEIKNLSDTSFDTIYEVFNQSFADYEIKINRTQFQSMLERRGFNPLLSFAAFEGDKIAAFTLNGIGCFKGIPTAYDTGTGTLPNYRGKGLATDIFNYSIPFLKKEGIRQYLLEVLQHNTKAVSVYRKIDFKTTREFNYFNQENKNIRIEIKKPDFPYFIKQINIEEHLSVSDFWDFYPSWQNSLESIKRATGKFVILGAVSKNSLLGYCVIEPATGDITQIAVDKQYRRKGIASLLFSEIVKYNENDAVKVINTDISCTSINNFLEAINIKIKGKQFEMLKQI